MYKHGLLLIFLLQLILCDPSLKEIKSLMQNLYGENKEITDKNYDKSLSITCNNGIL